MDGNGWAGTTKPIVSGGTIGRLADGPVTPLLDDVNQLIATALGRVNEAAERVRHFADSVHGSQPQGAESANKALGRSGRGGQVRDALDTLHAALSALEGEIARLNAI